METCLQPLWNLLREPCNQLMEISDFEDNSNRQILMQKRKDLLTGKMSGSDPMKYN